MGRKAKTPKFDTFKRLDNCFDWYLEENWRGYFEQEHPIVVEIGCGTAQLSLQLAQDHPDQNFLGVDIKSDRMYKAALRANQEHIKNLAFIRANIKLLPDIFKPGEVSEFWITFPDPFPKERDAKHRLLHPEFLAIYHQLLKASGQLHFKTDNEALFEWGLEQLNAENNWKNFKLSRDLHRDSNVADQAKIMTDYERKFMANNLTIKYCRLQKKSN